MFKMVTKILGVIALTGWMGAANATLIFDFSWDSDNGRVTGEILGLVDNAVDQAASGVLITSVNGIDSSPIIDILAGREWLTLVNNFSVEFGVMITYEFVAVDDLTSITDAILMVET